MPALVAGTLPYLYYSRTHHYIVFCYKGWKSKFIPTSFEGPLPPSVTTIKKGLQNPWYCFLRSNLLRIAQFDCWPQLGLHVHDIRKKVPPQRTQDCTLADLSATILVTGQDYAINAPTDFQ